MPRMEERIPLLTRLTAAWPTNQVDDALATPAAVRKFLVADVDSSLQRAPVTPLAFKYTWIPTG